MARWSSFVRETTFGRLVRVFKPSAFPYAEEKPGFVVPTFQCDEDPKPPLPRAPGPTSPPSACSLETAVGDDDEKISWHDDRQTKLPVVPDGIKIVTWYGPEDPANPQNWSFRLKCWIVAVIMFYTFAIYAGSSIVALGIHEVAEEFHVAEIVATLSITLFVVGYAVGPLFLSPLSEMASIGRNPPYVLSLFIFFILQIPSALVDNFAGLCVLRFLAGFMGSPPLATGGATLADVFSDRKLGYAMGLYGVALGVAPATAPFIAGFAIMNKGWRWSFWIMLMIAGAALVLLFFGLPETNADNILYRRAARLRKMTGDESYHAACEITAKEKTISHELYEALVRPMVLTVAEPIVLAIDLYQGLTYAILYSYFETFPMVFGVGNEHWKGYGWNIGLSGLPFIALTIGGMASYVVYVIWSRVWWEPRFVRARREGRQLQPEDYLPLSLPGAFCYPICLFWFAWSANRTHWISPTIASAIFGLADCWSFIPYLSYMAIAYPNCPASALASNDFVRSIMGAAMPIVARPLFNNLGIDWGNSLMGFISVAFIPIPFVLWKYGPWLRAKSSRAATFV
ncbi:benomyl/methotrexate resistance protein [Trichosporon asahii var. asahii CBS 8904]|uniref:Benomyl/methotrexate resistance protein n=1 Tax=Trichosporon asahii var. asahii (strain CBS 8904) TaxID=1220162 RepID=K1WSF2_TRIAC|nr:benomyl/methotrexate resistance protein [Trichosporon asahii var. asahii CBS 8904]